LVQKIREPLTPETQTIHAPSFDHSVKDPIQNDIAIPPTARIVLFEGLYVALDEPGWREANKLMDETWFVDVSIATATERVAKRNFGAGISASLEESLKRTEASDMRNARHVLDNRLPVQEVIPSLEDESWRSEEVMRVDDDLREQKLNEQELRRGRMERMDSIALLAEDGVGL
jgi:pantothenate kinase